ncbi:MAG: HEAT repeat domain-containing protein [Treponema sp.]|jgi:outer membrane protein assembly factor BamB|nr:HEAT repeat domain-containing protein [Treponema sp.]
MRAVLSLALLLLLLGTPLRAAETADTPPVWRQALGGIILGPPSVQAGSVAMICDGKNLRTLGAGGSFLWDFYAQGRLSPYLTRSPEGTSFVCRTDGILIAVNRAGRELWRINLGKVITAPVLQGWDRRIFVFTGEKVSCFNAAGYTLWTLALEHEAALAPQPDLSGGILLALDNGELLRIDAFGRARSQSLGAAPAAVVPLAEEDGEAALILYRDGRAAISRPVRAISRPVQEGYRLDPLPNLPAPPLASAGWQGTAAAGKGSAAVLLQDGRLILLGEGGGRILWTGESHVPAGTRAGDTALRFDDQGVFVLSLTGVSKFSLDGDRLWTFRLLGSSALPALGEDGLLYSGGEDWILYAYQVESGPGPDSAGDLVGKNAPASGGSYGLGSIPPGIRPGASEAPDRLNSIWEDIRLGRTGDREEDHAAWLIALARDAPGTPATSRAEAARLLGYLGSWEYIPFLAELYFKDDDSLVKIAAAEALGRIGADPGGIVLRSFSNLIQPPLSYRNEQVLMATAAATGAICRFSGPLLSGPAAQILIALCARDRPAAVRARAQAELDTLALFDP